MITKTACTNYRINWDGETQKDQEDRRNYFLMLRALIQDLDDLNDDRIRKIFNKHQVKFVDLDNFPRVNLDIPDGCKTWGDR